MIRAVIFDMDGTILNTIGDLTDSLNLALKETGHRSGFSEEEIKLCFGWAVRLDMVKAIALSKGMPLSDLEFAGTEIPCEDIPASDKEIDELVAAFTKYYGAMNAIKTKPYDGIIPAIHSLKQAGYKVAVASNKRDEHVQKLTHLIFPGLFDFAVGQSEAVPRKPSPAMIEKAAAALGAKQEECVYLGDSEVDILTGKNGGFPVISVSWGFRTKEFLRSHNAEYIVNKAEDILPCLE